MKKATVLLTIVLVLSFFTTTWALLPFDAFKNAVKGAVIDGFTLDSGQTNGSRFSYRVTYKGKEENGEALIFAIYPNSTSFSAIALAMDHEKIEIDGRKALFLDGSKTGMASFSIILKNGVGRFELTHRNYMGKAMSRAELDKVLAKIKLADLEK